MTFVARQVLTAAELNDFAPNTITTTGDVTVGGDLTVTGAFEAAAGLTTYVQYNDGGAFAGSSDFTFDSTSSTLTTAILQLPVGPDVNASGGGSLRLGNYGTQSSMALDANEIQAFNSSGNPSTLNLNIVGSGISVGNASAPGSSTFNGSVTVTGDVITDDLTVNCSSTELAVQGSIAGVQFISRNTGNRWVVYNSSSALRFWESSDRMTLTTSQMSTARLRLSATDDVAATSTLHAFQIGADSGTNLRIDNNEIMVLNNGTPTDLYLNIDGGDINMGGSGLGETRIRTANVIIDNTLQVSGTTITNYVRNSNGNFLALEGGDSWNLGSNASGEYVWLAAEGGIVIVSSDSNSTVWANRNQVRISPTGGIDERLQIHARIYSAKTTGSEIADFYRTGSAPGNYTTLLVRNEYANHSWGIVGEFRIEGNSGNDKPAILFSSGQTSTTWAVGFNYTDDTFGIKQNRGHRNTSWGTDRLTITNAGITRVNTNSGYVDIGPVNTSYCHITTDRSQFYFNKKLVVDSGQISSYNENLTLQVNGSTVCVFEATDRMYLQTSTRGIQFANNDYLDYDDSLNRFTFTDDGATGMYTDDGTTYTTSQFYSGGTLRVSSHATVSGIPDVGADNLGGFVYKFISSKASIKENIQDMGEVGDIIDQLRPVTFVMRYRPEDELDPFAEEDETAKAFRLANLQYGFVADEVAEIADGKLCHYEWDNTGTTLEPLNWKHYDVLAVAIKEIQSLRQRVADLEAA